jgi:hypothetical protein
MHSLFDSSDRQSILQRLERLEAGSQRQWGKMNPAQMLTHCSLAFEVPIGDRAPGQALIGRILGPFFRSSFLGDKPFGRNSPTDPTFVVSDDRDFAAEKQRLVTMIDRFCQGGAPQASKAIHSFFGRLSGDEWGCIMYKHLDHHLRQFGA